MPQIMKVELDNEISLALASIVPIERPKGLSVQDINSDNPFKANNGLA